MGILQQLIRARRKKKLSQAEVGRRMNVSRQQVNNLEKGRDGSPTIETLERYAKAVKAKITVQILD